MKRKSVFQISVFGSIEQAYYWIEALIESTSREYTFFKTEEEFDNWLKTPIEELTEEQPTDHPTDVFHSDLDRLIERLKKLDRFEYIIADEDEIERQYWKGGDCVDADELDNIIKEFENI